MRLCRSCLRRFGDLRKNTPLDFWSMYLVDFSNFDEVWTKFQLNRVNNCELNDGWGPHENSPNHYHRCTISKTIRSIASSCSTKFHTCPFVSFRLTFRLTFRPRFTKSRNCLRNQTLEKHLWRYNTSFYREFRCASSWHSHLSRLPTFWKKDQEGLK